MTTGMALHWHTSADVPGLREELIDAHVDARAELQDQPFYSAERFGERLDNYAKDPTFTLVTGRLGDLLVGYAFGGTLPETTRWWQGLQETADPDLSRETGSRTFAFREILVRKAYQAQGYGHVLHDALLADRPEERATLLVRPDNPARDLYLRWGWRIVGKIQPFPDSPRFDSMIRPLSA